MREYALEHQFVTSCLAYDRPAMDDLGADASEELCDGAGDGLGTLDVQEVADAIDRAVLDARD